MSDERTQSDEPDDDDGMPEELVLGLVAPLGSDKGALIAALREFCRKMGLGFQRHRLSTLISAASPEDAPDDGAYSARIDSLIKAGNALREVDLTAVALLATQEIRRTRQEADDSRGIIHLVDSIKHPNEVLFLRDVYRRSFYLISLHSPKEARVRFLVNKQGMLESEAQGFIARDEKEGEAHQQRTRDAFEIGDVFLTATTGAGASPKQITRFMELTFGHPFRTPTRDEYGMFLAHSAGLRSASLSRQVGAAIVTSDGDLISTGCNDVPKAHGGQYWPGDLDQRDFVRLYDSNDEQKNRIIARVVEALDPDVPVDDRVSVGREKLKGTGLLDLTEYGRDVHAEMEALLSAARMGKGTVGATLYTTTFPCHNCTKHIVSAGIRRVVFIEPYPKSKADQLHYDAIEVEPTSRTDLVPFEAFIGVGPRRFFDLFSMNLSSGRPVERKHPQSGEALEPTAVMRIRTPEPIHSLEDLEISAASRVNEIIQSIEDSPKESDAAQD